MEYQLYLNELWGSYYISHAPGMFGAWAWTQEEAASFAADPARCHSCEYLYSGCPVHLNPDRNNPVSRQLCY
jgi:hypothetical protein